MRTKLLLDQQSLNVDASVRREFRLDRHYPASDGAAYFVDKLARFLWVLQVQRWMVRPD